MHMVLAPVCLSNKKYYDFYKNLNKYLILDNGAHENNRLEFKDILKLAQKLECNEVVLLDEFFNSKKTLELVENCLKFNKPSNLKYQAVVQAENFQKFIELVEIYEKEKMIDVIGFPYKYAFELDPGTFFKIDYSTFSQEKINNFKHINTRVFITRFFASKIKKNIHLLGSWDCIELKLHISKNLRSIDTSTPVWQAFFNNLYTNNGLQKPKITIPIDFDAKLNSHIKNNIICNIKKVLSYQWK